MVGQQRHGLDRLGPGQQARRAAASGRASPCPCVGASGGDAGDRAFRHVAGHRREAVEPPGADAVGQRVDQVRRCRAPAPRTSEAGRLPGVQRLGHGAVRVMISMPKPGSMVVDLVAEQPGQPLGVALRHGQAHAHRLDAVVDAVATADRAGARRGPVPPARRRARPPACRYSGRWSRRAPMGSAKARRTSISPARAQGLDRLGASPKRLVEPAARAPGRSAGSAARAAVSIRSPMVSKPRVAQAGHRGGRRRSAASGKGASSTSASPAWRDDDRVPAPR